MITNLPHGLHPHLLGAPPPRDPRPALVESGLTGKRVVLIRVDERTGRSHYIRDHRAVSEVLAEPEGQRVVRVVDEATWYGGYGGATGNPWPAELVWVE